MGYTTPGKFSLGVDTSAASLKKDVKKNLAKKGGLGVDTSIKHDTSKSAAAVKKAINAPTTKKKNKGNGDIVWKDEHRYDRDEKAANAQTPGGNVPMGSAEDIAELKALNPTSKGGGPSWPKGDGSDLGSHDGKKYKTMPWGAQDDRNDKGDRSMDRFAGTYTRQNKDMKSNIANWEASKLKNTSRGHYTGDQTATTGGGSLKISGKLNPVTTTETYGNITKPGGGTGFIPKGKGSTVNSYSVDIEDGTSNKTKDMGGSGVLKPKDTSLSGAVSKGNGYTNVSGDTSGNKKAASEKVTGKQKRQANRKTRQTDRQEKKGKKTMDIALKRLQKQEDKKKKKNK